jgi:hypothetical protein
MGNFPQTDNVIYSVQVIGHFIFYFIVTTGILLVAQLVGVLHYKSVVGSIPVRVIGIFY